MNYYIVIIILILSIFIYYLFFLENYLFIKSSFLSQNDFYLLKSYLKNIHTFEENDEKKYHLFDIEKHQNIYDIIISSPFF